MSESVIAVPASLDGPSLADWAEAAMFIEERKHLSRASLRDRIRGSLLLEGEELDVQIELLLSEVDRRNRICGSSYPFEWSDIGVSRREIRDDVAYEFLLWLSVSPRFREEDRYNEVDEPFDQLVKQALMRYMGAGSKGVRFAFPSSDERPTGFPDAVKWLAGLLGLSTGAAAPRPKLKDGGVDVVVWRPFRDGRSGFAVILCQCTVQRNWPRKATDIVADRWNGWIDFAKNPLTALAVPFTVSQSFEQWDEIRRTMNIILDRLRICELVEAENIEDLDRLRQWTDRERGLLAVL